MSKTELGNLKKKIMTELQSYGVQIYQFPNEDEEVGEINSSLNVSLRNMDSHGTLDLFNFREIFAQ